MLSWYVAHVFSELLLLLLLLLRSVNKPSDYLAHKKIRHDVNFFAKGRVFQDKKHV